MNKAIGQLTVKEREAIFHFYFELYSYQQIADIMGYTQVKTARSLVYKAVSSLRNIRKTLNHHMESMPKFLSMPINKRTYFGKEEWRPN